MNFARESRWEVTEAEARQQQREVAALVSLEDRTPAEVRLVVGVDAAVGRAGELGRVAAVVWSVEEGRPVEEVAIERPLKMPYIPGLLAFREGPLVEEVLRLLTTEPDVVLLDGQGLAHPRRCGIACQIGVLLERPAIGVAKSRLFGRAAEPGPEPGAREPLHTPDGELIGYVLRTRTGSKPLYVSPGHLVSPERAVEIVQRCGRGHRLPEPLFLADRLSKTRNREPGNGETG